MAYVAITCLMNTIQQSIQLTGCNLQSSYKKLQSLRAIVEFPCSSVILGDIEALTRLEAQITRLTYTTEDMVDLESRNVFLAKNQISRRIAIWKLRFLLKQAVRRVDFSMKKWIEMMNNTKDKKVRNLTLEGSSQNTLETENMMVGYENEFEMIQDQLTRGENELEVVSIVGMGGIGKTTLATKIYSDPLIMSRFDIRAKATVSQEYRASNVLLGLLSSISGKTAESHEQQEDWQLADRLQKLLKRGRYLVVIDDIWTTEAWDEIKLCFPDCNNGSRILLTTRNVEVAGYASSGKPPYHMRLMNFDESWNLLHRKVFEKECSSPEFEKIGKQIALKCGGLPLAITVIAGLLFKIGRTLDEWQSVSENVSSLVSIDLDAQCMKVLALSYHHLPSHLKPCFLYFAIFPEDELIFVDKIVELWAVEGFLKVEEMKSIEEMAETCLNELIDRNLISINSYSFDGKIESCGMHDVTRELCLREARNINFVNILRKKNDQIPNVESMHFSSMSRVRISIQYVMFKYIVEKILDRYPINEFRSLICFRAHWFMPKFPFKLVRVLDLTLVRCNTFPSLILDLIHLRYLALTLFPSLDICQEEEVSSSIDIPPSISNLCYLQAFIISHDRAVKYPFVLPSEMLTLSQLRQLCLDWNYLRNHEPTEKSTLVLKNLECLSGWNPWYCTSSDLRLFPNLKKLQICGVREDFCSHKDLYDFRYLDQLEELEFRLSDTLASCFLESITPSGPLRFQTEARYCENPVPPLLLSPLDAFPQNLKNLTFSGHFVMPGKNFSIVGKLPKLESLKLSNIFFKDGEWEVAEEGFPHLKFVLLECLNISYWRASSDHFPCLERLFLERCLRLDSIPQDFADITTLALIDIHRCAQSVGNSAKQIQQDMEDKYASSIEVHIR